MSPQRRISLEVAFVGGFRDGEGEGEGLSLLIHQLEGKKKGPSRAIDKNIQLTHHARHAFFRLSSSLSKIVHSLQFLLH